VRSASVTALGCLALSGCGPERPRSAAPTTPAAAEVVSGNVLTDMITRVIVDKVAPEAAIDEANKRIKEIYDRLPVK